jgi:hypothetical protein
VKAGGKLASQAAARDEFDHIGKVFVGPADVPLTAGQFHFDEPCQNSNLQTFSSFNHTTITRIRKPNLASFSGSLPRNEKMKRDACVVSELTRLGIPAKARGLKAFANEITHSRRHQEIDINRCSSIPMQANSNSADQGMGNACGSQRIVAPGCRCPERLVAHHRKCLLRRCHAQRYHAME